MHHPVRLLLHSHNQQCSLILCAPCVCTYHNGDTRSLFSVSLLLFGALVSTKMKFRTTGQVWQENMLQLNQKFRTCPGTWVWTWSEQPSGRASLSLFTREKSWFPNLAFRRWMSKVRLCDCLHKTHSFALRVVQSQGRKMMELQQCKETRRDLNFMPVRTHNIFWSSSWVHYPVKKIQGVYIKKTNPNNISAVNRINTPHKLEK